MKSIVIADSGSTKTTWCFLSPTTEDRMLTTMGLNPYFVSSEQVKDCLEKEIYPFIDNNRVEQVYFFGSGCANEYKQMTLYPPLEDFFPHARISVEGDLTGAAVALYGNTPGLVAILGTGSSAGFYDGRYMTQIQPSLGFILGDEGSGASVGKHLLQDYLHGEMPEDIRGEFAQFCPGESVELLERVYKRDLPNRFLGSLATFVSSREENPYICNLLRCSFGAFFEKQVLKIGEAKSYPLKIMGSLAYHLRDVITHTARSYGLEVSEIKDSPMEGLKNYYRVKIDEDEALKQRMSVYEDMK